MKNQTLPEWIGASDFGTGVFYDPGRGKWFVRDIRYDDCVLLGEHVACFRWVPETVASYEELILDSCPVQP